MRSLIILSTLGLALAMPSIGHAAMVNGKSTTSQSSARTVNNQTAVSCNICFTCGGDWPVFAGSIRSVGDLPNERASACSSTLTARSDSSPFLCCR